MEARINLTNKYFQIKFENKVPSPIKFQLEYFGFKENNELLNTSEFTGLIEETKFIKTLDYLTKKNYKTILCDQSSKYLDKLNSEEKTFQEKTNLLISIKDQENSIDYNDFLKSINFLYRELKEHQKKSFYHLYKSKCAANFSVPGSGKTSVVLAYYEKMKLENKVDAIFIIGPKNCYYSWLTEFKINLNRDPKMQILGPNLNDRKIVYQKILKNELFAAHFATITNDIEYLKKFFSVNRFLLVVDEAHNIKKIEGTWSNSVLELSSYSQYKAILTGTPLPNDLRDVYNYLDFLYGENKIISSLDKARIEIHLEKKERDEAAILLREKIYPFYTRVTKQELNLSKPVFNNPILIGMNPIEKKIYDAIVTKIKYYGRKNFFDNIDLIQKICRARIIRLKQTSSYVKNLMSAFPEEIVDDDENLLDDKNIKSLIANYDELEKPAKLIHLVSMVKSLAAQNKKVLIWSTHLLTIELILNELKKENINIKKIVGKTELSTREDIKNEFNDKNSGLDVIVALPQACSESISLHKACQNAIYYDLNYNAAEFLQSLDRIHRVGGSETIPVQYDFLHYSDTVDIKIYERVFEKANRQMQVIEQDNFTFDLEDEEGNWETLYNDLNL